MNKFSSTARSFTHIDVVRRVYDDGRPNDKVSLERLVADVAVVDVAYKKPRKVITAKDLDKGGGHLRDGENAIISTAWTEPRTGSPP